MGEQQNILIVGDDKSAYKNLGLILEGNAYMIYTAGTGEEALEEAKGRAFRAAFLDMELPDMKGTALLGPLREIQPDMMSIMVTNHADLENAMQALSKGASAYVVKPLNSDEVLAILGKAFETQRLLMENKRLHEEARRQPAEREPDEQFFQSREMEAMGRLAGGVAHDFNNLLTTIMGHSDIILMDLKVDDPIRQDLLGIKGAADRAASLTRQLQAFSRRQVLQPTVLDLNRVIKDMEERLRKLLGEDVKLSSVLGPDIGYVKADPEKMEQVILDLAANAGDAMPDGGKLTIETARVDLDDSYARKGRIVEAGRYIMMAVSDTGVGMDKDTQTQIFEPFFTTKDKGRGIGWGLSAVYGIVKQSGGFIRVYSEPGQGATFRIYFPRVEEEVESAPKEHTPEGSA